MNATISAQSYYTEGGRTEGQKEEEDEGREEWKGMSQRKEKNWGLKEGMIERRSNKSKIRRRRKKVTCGKRRKGGKCERELGRLKEGGKGGGMKERVSNKSEIRRRREKSDR